MIRNHNNTHHHSDTINIDVTSSESFIFPSLCLLPERPTDTTVTFKDNIDTCLSLLIEKTKPLLIKSYFEPKRSLKIPEKPLQKCSLDFKMKAEKRFLEYFSDVAQTGANKFPLLEGYKNEKNIFLVLVAVQNLWHLN